MIERMKERRSAELYSSALICSVIANVNRGKGRPFSPADFMPKEERKKKVMSIDEMLESLKVITIVNGGEVIGGI